MSWGTGRQGQLGRIGERLLERDAKVTCNMFGLTCAGSGVVMCNTSCLQMLETTTE